jgi:hypothetical protein
VGSTFPCRMPFFSRYAEDGRPGHNGQKARVASLIADFKAPDGSIIGSRLIADWFPQFNCQVFISHAHKDSELAIGLAGFLKYEFGITSFIDSCVWGHSDRLLGILDDNYCWQERSQTYDYSKRNRSTAHVHMMLLTALAKMLNQCECVMFLNTPESITVANYIGGSATESPWIYAELAMTTLIEKRSRQQHRLTKSMIIADEALRIKYNIDLRHLEAIGADEFTSWQNRARDLEGFDALDVLYHVTTRGS